MRLSNKVGFTIIETMLFLGISGLLLMGILIGTGSSINIQRYRDSITSLQAFFQQQYSNVSNVSNDRTFTNLPCGSAVGVPVGQSDCVILGEFITTTDSRNISVQSVVGYIPLNSISSLDDINVFLANGDGVHKGYNIQVSSVTGSSYEIEWGASLIDTVSNFSKSMIFSMLVLRSPSSGAVRTFIGTNADAVDSNNIQTLVSKAALTRRVEVCVDSNGLMTGSKMAVVIDANTTSASGIETLGGTSGC